VNQSGDPSPIPDRVLDTIGLFCPVPIIKTAKAMKEMKAGEILLLVSDDRGVLVDLPAWCRMAKEELVQMTEEAAIVRALVRKTDPAHRSPPAAAPPPPPISS
jgi:tRNA 2-thiouridine synthesizing protein A